MRPELRVNCDWKKTKKDKKKNKRQKKRQKKTQKSQKISEEKQNHKKRQRVCSSVVEHSPTLLDRTRDRIPPYLFFCDFAYSVFKNLKVVFLEKAQH